MFRAGEKFTDGERAGLSEEELAVLESDTEDEDGKAALSQIADDDDDDGEADADAKAKAAQEAAAKAAAEKEAKEAERKAAEEKAAEDKRRAALSEESRAAEDKARQEAEDKAKAEAEAKAREETDRKAREAAAAARTDDDDEPFVPAYIAPKPENYEQRVKDLDARQAEATAQMKAGKLELDAMLTEHAKVEAERRELEAQRLKHEMSVEQQQQAGEQRWRWEVRRFMRDVKKHEGIDYEDSIRLNSALDDEVKRLANDAANKDHDGAWFLQEAHKAVKTKLALKPAVDDKAAKEAAEKARKEAETKAANEKAAKDKAGKERKPPVDKLPKTLGGLPSAGAVDIGSDGEGEFADAEALMAKGDSMAVEAYIAGKSAEWQERWARYNG